MPVDRLVLDDRRHIAARLADGTAYAEIARQLARPTSTISREVQRNGGPGRYRAEQAQRAATTRARRRPTRTAAAPHEVTPATGRDPRAVEQLREDLTAMVARTGLSPMASRVLTHLFTDDAGGLSAAQLAEQLRVSPASVSKAVRDLESQELLRRERDPHRRRDRYVVDDDVWIRAWLASARMNWLLAETARRGARILGADTTAGARLNHTGRFLEHVTRDMTEAAEHWRHALRAEVARDE